MQTLAQKKKSVQQRTALNVAKLGTVNRGASRRTEPSLHFQRALGNQAVQRLLRANSEGLEAGCGFSATDRFPHDFSRLPVRATTNIASQRRSAAALSTLCTTGAEKLGGQRQEDSLTGRLHLAPSSHIDVKCDGSEGSSSIHAARGLKPDAGDVEILRGRTLDEFVGDVARPVGTFFGNLFGGIVGALTGISISSTTNAGPTWNNNGAFVWHVAFNTTGRNGWIVQEITNTWRAENAAGNAVPSPLTPHYWEAWVVDGAGNVTPTVGADNDFWDNPDLQAATGAAKGHWSTTGGVHFTTRDPATQGFSANNPATNAGILLSTTAAPASLGIARLHRYAQGTWDSTGVAPTHTGSAGP